MTDSVNDAHLYEKLLYSEAEVDKRIAEMAAAISKDYKGKKALFVCLLNGAQPFTAKLMLAIHKSDPSFQPNVQSMIVSRYGANLKAGELKLVTDLPPEYRDLKGYHVVILDDLVDAGGTLDFARQHLLSYGAEAVDYIVLVKKLKKEPSKTEVTMFGFTVPDVWVTGMGMDDPRIAVEGNRWAGWIAEAKEP